MTRKRCSARCLSDLIVTILVMWAAFCTITLFHGIQTGKWPPRNAATQPIEGK